MDRSALAAVTTLLLSLAPGFEGRYAVIAGVALGLDPLLSILVSCIGDAILALALATAASYIDRLLLWLADRGGAAGRAASYLLHKIASARVKVERYVRRWGAIGLALFVAAPIPVTGVWTGALVGYLIGLDRRRLALALAVGGLASVLVIGIPLAAASRLGVGTQ
ncbi:MAG: small multi-drug export protein [Crenarchaeota archaeon]|nr:small multi-drug export protein [Thermoproteota archaeon]